MAGLPLTSRSNSFGTRRFTRLVLLGVLTVAALPGLADSEAGQREKLEVLKQSIESLQAELRSVKSSRSELLNALEESEKSIGELSSKAEKLQKELEEQERVLNRLHERKTKLEDDKSAQQGHVGEHINAAYRLGQQSRLRLLLNQQDPSLVARNLKYFDYLNRARIEKIGGYVATLNELKQVELQIVTHSTQLRQNQSELRERHQQLSAQHGRRKSTLDKLEATIASKDERLQQLQRNQQRLEQVLRQVVEVFDIKLPSDAGTFANFKGQLPWPTEGRIAERFGSERVAGKVRWQGLVISAEAGTPVIAIHHGRVVFSDYLRGHGLLVIIDHGTGFMSLYARNQVLYKEIGEWVNAGDVIATVGNSGGQEHAGLYFELRHNGQPTDPQAWIKTT